MLLWSAAAGWLAAHEPTGGEQGAARRALGRVRWMTPGRKQRRLAAVLERTGDEGAAGTGIKPGETSDQSPERPLTVPQNGIEDVLP
jgi:hypothetical protein